MATGAVDWTFGGVTRVLGQGFGERIAAKELPQYRTKGSDTAHRGMFFTTGILQLHYGQRFTTYALA